MTGDENVEHRKPSTTSPRGTAEGASGTGMGTGSARKPAPFTLTAGCAIPNAGIRAGEIIGYRAWMVEGGKLRSMFADYTWVPGPQRCDYHPNGCAFGWAEPGEYAHILRYLGGFHSYNDPTCVLDYYGDCAWGRRYIAFGSIAMWGEVIEYDLGWRSEFARVKSITSIACEVGLSEKLMFWKPLKKDIMLDGLRKRYGCQ